MLKAPKFTKRKEDFTCGHCHYRTKGTGYTNHCPKCLWSKHVDDNPGDRLNKCSGLMKPIDLESKKGGYILIHQCLKCGVIKKNKSTENDDFHQLIKLVKK